MPKLDKPDTVTTLIVEDPNKDGDLWIECRLCGGCNYQSKGPIRHKRGCDSSAQYRPGDIVLAPTSAPAQAPGASSTPKSGAQLDREIQESLREEELRKFSANVRRTGMTKGRDEDTREAVRRGYLSESDAMNTDD